MAVTAFASGQAGVASAALPIPPAPVLPVIAPTLRALALSTTFLTKGRTTSIDILNATPGSTLSSGALPAGLTLNAGLRTITGTPTTGGRSAGTLTETPVNAAPRVSAFELVVDDPGAPATANPSIAFGAPTYSITEGNTGTKTLTIPVNLTRDGLTGAQTVNFTYGGTATSGSTSAPASFADTFNRANEALGASSNWTRIGGAAGDAAITGNAVACTTTDGTGTAYLSPDRGSVSQYVECSFGDTGSGFAGSFVALSLTDANNFIGMRYSSKTGVIEMYSRVAGSLTLIGSTSTGRADGDLFRMIFDSATSKVSVTKNGTEIVALTTVSALPPITSRAGIVARGIANGFFLDNYTNAASGAAISTADYATPPVSLTIGSSVSTGSLVLTINGDTDVEPDETIIVNGALAGAAGVTATTTVTVVNDDVASPTSTIMFIGSSTPAKYFTDFTGPANANVTTSKTGTSFAALGTTGAGATNFGTQLNTLLGKPVRLIDKGVGGTTAAGWDANTSSVRSDAVNAALAAGGVDAIVCIVGFNDANTANTNIASPAAHLAVIRSLYSKLRAELGQPNVPIIIGTSQLYTVGTINSSNNNFTYVRSAEMTATDDANNYFGAHSYDLPQLSDGIHQAAASYPVHAERLAYNVAAALGTGTIAKGPQPNALTAIYQTRTKLSIAHSTGTDFTPTTGLTGLQLSFDNFSTTAAISAVDRLSATEVAITHAASNGSVPSVRWFVGKAPDVSAVLKDNTARALPIWPTKASITAAVGTTTVDPALVPPPVKIARVNFTSSDKAGTPATPTGWNAVACSSIDQAGNNLGQTSSVGVAKALTNTSNAAIGWTLTTTTNVQAGTTSGATTGNNSGAYPDAVIVGVWYNGDSVGNNGRIESTTHTITGLNPAKTYKLDFLGSRSGTTDRQTAYSAGGQSVTQNNMANTGTVSTLTNLSPDSSGALTYTFTPAGTAAYGYLNALVITEL